MLQGPQPALLADSLEVLRLRSWIRGRLELHSPWGFQFAGRVGWFHLVLGSPYLVEVEPDSDARSACRGDMSLVFQGHGHRLLGKPDSPATPVEDVLSSFRRERIGSFLPGKSASQSLISGSFLLDGLERTALYASLPPVIRCRGDGNMPLPYVEYILRLIFQETASGSPCAQLVINRLVRILLIKAVQGYLSALPGTQKNLLTAISDPQVGRALALMHAEPNAPWTVASLAEQVAMSRSMFSARFTEMVGKPPMEYLFDWRMQKASYLLRTLSAELNEVASKVGYESASAFSKAFARWAGVAPGTYRQTMHSKGSVVSVTSRRS